MPELRAIVAMNPNVTKRVARNLAVQLMRREGRFDARKVRCVGPMTHADAGLPTPIPGVGFLAFAVDATPNAA